MSINKDAAYCPRCEKPLQAVFCLACVGKGYVWDTQTAQRKCYACHGTGQAIRCPDHWSHTRESLSASLNRLRQRNQKSAPILPPTIVVSATS